jgi:hypothetical protein
MNDTFSVSIPTYPDMSPAEYVAWVHSKIDTHLHHVLVQAVVQHLPPPGSTDPITLRLHDGVTGIVPQELVCFNELVPAHSVLKEGQSIIAKVEKIHDYRIVLSTQHFTWPYRDVAELGAGQILKGTVFKTLTSQDPPLDLLSRIALPNGAVGYINAGSFMGNLPLSKRLPVGREVSVELLPSASGFGPHSIEVSIAPEREKVYKRMCRAHESGEMIKGIVSGRTAGSYYVALDGVLDGLLHADLLKTYRCGCNRCSTEHPEEFTLGQEIEVQVKHTNKNGARYRVGLTRKDVP